MSQKKLSLSKGKIITDFAPWIPNTISLLRDAPNVRLVIVCPVNGMKKLLLKHDVANVRYYFYKSDIPLLHKKIWQLPIYFNQFIADKYWINKLIVRCIAWFEKPNIVHLHGAENPYYSSTVLQFKKKLPVFITIQGFISFSTHTKDRWLIERIRLEQQILREFSHFGIRTDEMQKDVLRFNPQAKLLWHGYGMASMPTLNLRKIFDIVFFARICKDKGIEDLIIALEKVKSRIENVKLAIIGSGSSEYLNYLKQLALHHGVLSNIDWLGFQPTQSEVHKLATQAKVSVLPTYHDIVSGTIVESMKLGIPVVAYKTGSIPELNLDDHIVELVDRGNVEQLAEKILLILENDVYALEIAQRAKKYADKRFSNASITEDIMNCYQEVIKDFEKQRKKKL